MTTAKRTQVVRLFFPLGTPKEKVGILTTDGDDRWFTAYHGEKTQHFLATNLIPVLSPAEHYTGNPDHCFYREGTAKDALEMALGLSWSI